MTMASTLPPPIGESPSWLLTLERISDAAGLERPVLIVGARGTGKTLAAERAHFLSPRWGAPLQTVTCAAYSADHLYAEVFGQADTAGAARAGRAEQADGGTLFIDGIEYADIRFQEALLRFLDTGETVRRGANQGVEVDCRLIAATSIDLPAYADTGRFRHDLIDRLSLEVITLPPLSARPGDATLLAEHYGRRIAGALDYPFEGFSPASLELLEGESWPGNVRQLRTTAERAVRLAAIAGVEGPVVISEEALDPFKSPFRPKRTVPGSHMTTTPAVADLNTELQGTAHTPQGRAAGVDVSAAKAAAKRAVDFDNAVRAFEMSLIDQALSATKQHQGDAAEVLGLSYNQMRSLLRKYGYQGKRGRPTKNAAHHQGEAGP